METARTEEAWKKAWSNFAGPSASLRLRAASGAPSQASPEKVLHEQEVAVKHGIHPARAVEWLNARKVEAEIRNEIGPMGLQSLSHTQISDQSFALAVGLGRPEVKRVLGIGVDLESAHRRMEPKVVERLVQNQERKWLESGEIEALDFWILKEAAFKATPANTGLVISAFTLVSWDGAQAEGEMQLPSRKREGTVPALSCRVKKVASSGLKAAFAYVFESCESCESSSKS